MTEAADLVSWIELGVIARPHGVDGEVRVHLYNPDSTLLEELTEVFVRAEPGEAPSLVDVITSRRGPKALLIRLAGVESREDAEALRGFTLCIPRGALPDLEEGEYYHADLIGLQAYEGDRPVGEVVEVLDYPSVECLKVETEAGFLEVPMLPKWLDRVDVDGGKVHLQALDDIPLQKGR
ncbi:MAG: ribosome maturation factor RimM [Myxococcales bacterium]|nr:ribosome maturation factor RimM [Myxococcales bacterium]MDH3845754.1 ribosome maturation factor RimM [Myxococcales bacterium]